MKETDNTQEDKSYYDGISKQLADSIAKRFALEDEQAFKGIGIVEFSATCKKSEVNALTKLLLENDPVTVSYVKDKINKSLQNAKK